LLKRGQPQKEKKDDEGRDRGRHKNLTWLLFLEDNNKSNSYS